jgi:hypothetical protein
LRAARDERVRLTPVPRQNLFVGKGADSIGPRFTVTWPGLRVFDGASRTTQTQQHLRIAGLGENPPQPGTTLLPFGGASIVTTTFLQRQQPRETPG